MNIFQVFVQTRDSLVFFPLLTWTQALKQSDDSMYPSARPILKNKLPPQKVNKN